MIPLLLIALLCTMLVAIRSTRMLLVLRKTIEPELPPPPQSGWKAGIGKWRPVKWRDWVGEIERLRQSELDHRARFKILAENVAAAVFIHRFDGTILWASPYTEVLTGFSLSEVYRSGSSFLRKQVYEDDRETVERAFATVAMGESIQCRYRMYHNSGIVLWLDTRMVPVFDIAANEYVALSVALDVTSSVNSERKTEERNRDLNEFTYMISHDLKAPIVTLRGMLGILDDELGSTASEEVGQALTYMEKATYRLEQLVEGILELARVSSTEKILEPIDIQSAINEVLEDFKFEMERQQAHITTVAELPWVMGNRTELYQIFSNLIGNALKYGESGRPLMISIAARDVASRYRVTIDVKDNGRGISEEYRNMIFKPFNRGGDDTVRGSGVGLACVKRLVEKLEGSISVQSVVGEGSVFTIELRRARNH